MKPSRASAAFGSGSSLSPAAPNLDWRRFAGRRVVLLQGPHGPFFARVASALRSAGADFVHKIDFNGGDALFSERGATAFRGRMDTWPQFFESFVASHQIDTVVVFGDCRPIHQVPRRLAPELGFEFWVFEEGYVRPNYVTFEQHGVNGNSQLPQTSAFYAKQPRAQLQPELPVGNTFWAATRYSIAYYAATLLLRWRFPHYEHHRRVSLLDGLCWLRALGRKWLYRWRERAALADLSGHGGSRPYYIQALQVATDAQIHFHSPYAHVHESIDEVVASFAAHASAQSVLLIKHHPLDRGYSDYSRRIDKLREKHRLGERLRYIHDQHLPTLMSHALGLVTVNSTVGLSALSHALPVKVLGEAIYNLPGLTVQQPLDRFWAAARTERPDMDLHARFVNHVIASTQINGSFYRALPGGLPAGLAQISNVHPLSAPAPLLAARPGPAGSAHAVKV
jgi:capsular polysaccharide export protein